VFDVEVLVVEADCLTDPDPFSRVNQPVA
jgi:hypothetical protein